MTSRPTEGGKSPLLSREMRLVLALLLLLALLGGWFVWTSGRDAAALADAPVPAPSGDPPAGGGEDTDAAAVAPAPGTTPQDAPQAAAPAAEAAVPVEPGAETEVPQIPAFGEVGDAPVGDVPVGEVPIGEASAEAVPTPGGINPDTPLAALPGRNPFRPLELEASGSSEAPASPVAAAPAAPAADEPFVPAGSATPSAAIGSGALALSPLPGTAGSRPATPAASQSTGTGTGTPSRTSGSQGSSRPAAGAFPTPRLPGTGSVSVTLPAPAPRASAPTAPSSAGRTDPPRTAPARTTPARTAPTTTTATPRTTPRTTAQTNRPGTATPNAARPSGAAPATTGTVPPAPRPAPVAGVSVPRDPVGLGAAPAAASSTPAPTGAVPNAPQPVTQFGLEASAASPEGPLGTLIQTRDLHFDAAVLGPVNTAILRSKDGYVVVSQGQTLPDSQVIVREVRPSGVTLELGGETLDLVEEAGASDAQPTGLTDALPVVIVSQPEGALAAWGDLAFIPEFDPAQTAPPADSRLALALAVPTPDLSRDQGEP